MVMIESKTRKLFVLINSVVALFLLMANHGKYIVSRHIQQAIHIQGKHSLIGTAVCYLNNCSLKHESLSVSAESGVRIYRDYL